MSDWLPAQTGLSPSAQATRIDADLDTAAEPLLEGSDDAVGCINAGNPSCALLTTAPGTGAGRTAYAAGGGSSDRPCTPIISQKRPRDGDPGSDEESSRKIAVVTTPHTSSGGVDLNQLTKGELLILLHESERQRLEAERRSKRLEFRTTIDSFKSRSDMMNYIESADFSSGAATIDQSDQRTAENIRDPTTATSAAEGVIKLSTFRRSMVLNASPGLTTRYLSIDPVAVRDIIRRKLFAGEQVKHTSCVILCATDAYVYIFFCHLGVPCVSNRGE